MIPIATFPRYYFPISWLVGSTPRIFAANQKQIIPGSDKRGLIMIARVEGEKGMVVIEQVEEYLYSMCALKKDLKVKDVRTIFKASKEKDNIVEVSSTDENMQIDGDEWWKNIAVRNITQGERGDVSLQFLLDERSPEFNPFEMD